MFLKQVLLPLIPVELLPRAREAAIRLRRAGFKWRSPISERQFKDILLERMGIKDGSLIFVHTSASKMNLGFPASRVVSILREVIGSDGTMVFPSWNHNASGIFDLRYTPTNMGLIAEAARRMPGAIRSVHPRNSMLAIGPLAAELTRDHPASKAPLDENSPLMKIVRRRGVIIGLGVTSYNLSLVHCPESVLLHEFPHPRFTRQLDSVPVIDDRGQTIEIELYRPVVSVQISPDILRYIRRHLGDLVGDFRVHGADFFVCDAARTFERMEQLARRGITMYRRRRRAGELAFMS